LSETANFIGESPATQAMLAHVSALAPLNRPLLIWGERGTGKELIAHRLAFLSPRWDKPFLTLNCGALNDSTMEAELFGYEPGAFTGATRRRPSRFELADGGTIFLDEIGNAPHTLQERLLRLIEYGTFERLGSNDTIKTDVRIIAATNADLRATGFRADLLDRLTFDVIRLPPLRERPEDIVPLATHFATRMAAELGRPLFAGFSAQATEQLLTHAWPGNVRELRNAVERSVARHSVATKLPAIALDPFGPGVPAPAAPAPAQGSSYASQRDSLERRLLSDALIAARHNQRAAAASLGLSYSQFRNACRRVGVGKGATGPGDEHAV
jgi:psp operon transcriptional activator